MPPTSPAARIAAANSAEETAVSKRISMPVEGRVVVISADSVTSKDARSAYFLAKVELIEDPAPILNGASIYPGMQADVMIVTGERTMLEYLFRPISGSFNRALREE